MGCRTTSKTKKHDDMDSSTSDSYGLESCSADTVATESTLSSSGSRSSTAATDSMDESEEIDAEGFCESVVPEEEMVCEQEEDKPESGSSSKEVDILTMLITSHPQLKPYEAILI